MTAPRMPAPPRLDAFRAPWSLFWIALLLRIGYMTLAHTWHFGAYSDHFSFGHEMGRIARALATGYGFADPFHGHTGPTAWEPPLYPWILGADFRLFGVYSSLAAWMILAFNSVLNALMVPLVWEIAARCFNRKVALWSAWIWVLYPGTMEYAVKWVWETTLTAFLFTAALCLALRMRRIGEPDPDPPPPSLRQWVLFGFLWGLIALANPSPCLFLPPCGIWILLGARRGLWRKQIPAAALTALIFLACLAPWTARNARVFHAFVPVRSDFGAELYLGNGPGSNGMEMGYDHPFISVQQFHLYRQMGEVAYSRWRGDLARQNIRQHPGQFLANSLRRFYFFWCGVPHPVDKGLLNELGRRFTIQFSSFVGLLGLALALRRRVPGSWLFLWAFLLIPCTYYFVAVYSTRFRHPLEPLIVICAVYLFESAEKSWRIGPLRRRRRAPQPVLDTI